MKNLQLFWQERAKTVLHHKRLAIGIELLIATAIQMLHLARIVPTAVIFLFFMGWLSLRLRQSSWRKIGLNHPNNWLRTIGIGLGIAILLQAFSIWVVIPVVQQLTQTPLDLSQFEPLRSNLSFFLISLVASWSYAAFLEEMVYRGYLLNRFIDLVGDSRKGWIWAGVGSSVLFGLGHSYQGVSGVVDTFISAGILSFLYFTTKRNLWLPILVHGIKDTIGFALIFFGLYP